ncbi:hypothetical protein AN476_07560 [Phaeobacter sp. 11ANDIMAR09]|nr:hypothetical protein AN476_07560 [Phaeobacter sp. 11ANDIMAR09]
MFALQRALGGHDGFDELTFWRVVKLEVQALNGCVPLAEGFAQVEVEPCVTGKAFEIVKDHHELLIWLGIKE